jgi:hypothetical protein
MQGGFVRKETEVVSFVQNVPFLFYTSLALLLQTCTTEY